MILKNRGFDKDTMVLTRVLLRIPGAYPPYCRKSEPFWPQ